MDYLKALGFISAPNDDVFWTVLAAIAANVIVFLELVSYMIFFKDIYQQNNSSVVRSAVRRSRNRTNAQTIKGQIYLFIMKFVFIGLVILCFLMGQDYLSIRLKDFVLTYKLLEFGLISVVQCFQIPELRLTMMNWFK